MVSTVKTVGISKFGVEVTMNIPSAHRNSKGFNLLKIHETTSHYYLDLPFLTWSYL